MDFLNSINDILWSYIMVALLLGCALWFTLRSRFVQFRMIPEMFRLLLEPSPVEKTGRKKHISSFQAFTISMASRVGIGNLAGVATAITIGGPGAVFWMWTIALLGSATAFVESTLAQIYKVRGKDSFIGGPAFYMTKGLGKRWMAVLFSILIIFAFGLVNNGMQSNTLCEAMNVAFGWDRKMVGIVIAALAAIIIFGGVHRIAGVSNAIVPTMAVGYLLLAIVVMAMNITSLPAMFRLIFENAFGLGQAVGGGAGAAMMMGIKRGLFSNEAGEGSTPNAAATAHVTHPVKQGLIQALGVFTDTIVVCSCTAFIILLSGNYTGEEMGGIQITQDALTSQIGPSGRYFIALAVFFFAFSTILGNYYYGEANIRYLTRNPIVLFLFRIAVAGMILFGATATLELVWGLVDIAMALMTICNLAALTGLWKCAMKLLEDYRRKKKAGIKSPEFHKSEVPDLSGEIECWD